MNPLLKFKFRCNYFVLLFACILLLLNARKTPKDADRATAVKAASTYSVGKTNPLLPVVGVGCMIGVGEGVTSTEVGAGVGVGVGEGVGSGVGLGVGLNVGEGVGVGLGDGEGKRLVSFQKIRFW
jgi:hypothetical protein